jgi:hypothetical protein
MPKVIELSAADIAARYPSAAPQVGDTKQTPATPEELESLLRTGIGGKRRPERKQKR